MRANDLSAAASQTARLSYPGGLERLDILGPTAKHAFRNEGREEAVPSPWIAARPPSPDRVERFLASLPGTTTGMRARNRMRA